MAILDGWPLSGTITGTGVTDVVSLAGKWNLSITGFGTATVALERSIDGGIEFNTIESFTSAAEKVGDNAGRCKYRFNCTSYTSGTIKYKLSQ